MKLVALAIAVAAYESETSQSQFVDFVKTYNKQYTSEEFFSRYEIFKATQQTIEAHNAKNLSWKMGINQFADLTWDEFKGAYLGKVLRSESVRVEPPRVAKAKIAPLEADPSLDWRTKGAVSPVRNQGQCGSCYAMTVVSAIESACYIATHNLTLLSEQFVMDCASTVGNQGCNGGFVQESFQWIVKNPVPTEACYPYTAESGKCNNKCPGQKWCVVTGVVNVPKDESQLMTAVNKQPLAVVVEADQPAWQSYSSGVMEGQCGKQLDHTALLIGYGTDSSKKYWILQNTWGTTWGEQGYIRLIRDKDQCGVADDASYPTVKAV